MISKKYKAHQSNVMNVIDIFNGYKRNKGSAIYNDGVNTEFLEKKVNNLKNKEFKLVVAGEVKAGKSTLINAILNERILPEDVLQASSTVVEIFKSEKQSLKVMFADRKEELHNDIEIVNKRLHELCRVRDEYRHIPTPQIDSDIINNESLVVDESYIKSLESRTRKDLQGEVDDIKRYIQEKSKSNIPVRIEYGYPLKWDFDELRIVDTPGVNAMGGFQDVSFSFLKNADAILFVHNQSSESESFRNFVDDTIPNQSKDMLFLVLTHAGKISEQERLHADAVRQYKDIIPENRILFVDSVLKLTHRDLHNGIPLEEIEKSKNVEMMLSYLQKKAEKEDRKLIDVVFENSGFEKMHNILDEFLSGAPILQIKNILEKIKCGYEQQESQYADEVQQLKVKKENRQKYSEEINRIKKARKDYKLCMNETAENLKRDYSGKHSSWVKNIENLKDKYSNLIEQSNDKGSLRKNFVDAEDSIGKTIDDFSKDIKQRLKTVLGKVDKKFESEYKIVIPKTDLEYLEQQAKEGAFKDEPQYESYVPWYAWFPGIFILGPLWMEEERCIGTEKVFDDKKFLDNLKTKCRSALTDMVLELYPNYQKVLDQFLDSFKQKMNSVIDEANKKLEEQKEMQQSNEDIRCKIDTYNEKKTNILQEKLRCVELLGNII